MSDPATLLPEDKSTQSVDAIKNGETGISETSDASAASTSAVLIPEGTKTLAERIQAQKELLEKEFPTLSKTQQKKQLRRLKRLELRPERRKAERERVKANRKLRKLAGEPTKGAVENFDICEDFADQRIGIELAFYDKMTPDERNSLYNQVGLCYATNRRLTHPCTLTVFNIDQAHWEESQAVNKFNPRWPVQFLSDFPADVDTSNVIYLCAESENVVDRLDRSKFYVIGGIVDRNRYPSFCYNRAVEAGYQHARLPIGEFLTLQTRHVLTVNHVFDILVMHERTGDWKLAFDAVIPQRKFHDANGPKVDGEDVREHVEPEPSSAPPAESSTST